MPTEELKKLAEELKESREKAEITLQHVASKTRIDFKFLKALEDGDFEVLPDVYIRAFLKEYAVICGLDPVKTVEKYELAKKGKPIEHIETESSEKGQERAEPEIKREFVDESTLTINNSAYSYKQKLILYTGIALVVVIIIAVYFLFIKNSPPEIVVEKPFDEVLQEQSKRFEITEDDSPAKAVVVDSLTLSIKATDTCWVNLTIDGSVDREFMLFRNTSASVKAAQRFDIIVGNAGGVSIELNGAPLEISGRKGERKTFSVNKDGLIKSTN